MKQAKVIWQRVLILVLGLASACILFFIVGKALTPTIRGCILSLFMLEDLIYTTHVAHTMIDYDLPPGYQEQRAMQVNTYYSLAILASNSHPSDLIVIQTATDLMKDPEYGISSQERAAQEIGGIRYQTHMVNTQEVVIRNQPFEPRILEGTDKDGSLVRQALTVIPGKNSNVMLIIIGDIETWDQVVVNQFLNSIR